MPLSSNKLFPWMLLPTFLVFNSGDGGISLNSPYIYVGFLLGCLLICVKFVANQVKLSVISILLAITFLLSATYHSIYFNDPIFLGRATFLLVSPLAIYLLTISNSQIMLQLVIWGFFLELILRLMFSWSGVMGLYSLKQSLIFPDTNFIGVTLGFGLLLAFVSNVTRANVIIASILLFTASRTAWLAVAAARLGVVSTRANRCVLFGLIVAPIPLVLMLSEFLSGLDGSLGTKVDIFITILTGSLSTHDVLFGLGKANVKEFAEVTMGRSVHVGHTLPGNVMQYGLITVLSYLVYTSLFLPRNYRGVYFTFVLAAGMTGLFPFAYLPLVLLVARAAIKAEERKCLML